MKTKTIKKIIPSQKVNMGGFILDQPLPDNEADYIDPFLLIHHGTMQMYGDQHQRDVGVGPHPHRGFSPVTFIFSGNMQHRDSLGNDATVGEGGTQWMFAGKGITHSERPSKELAEQGGATEFIQFWVNAPAKHKMDPASYRPLSKEDTPVVEDNGVSMQVVSGSHAGVTGPIDYFSPLTLLRGTAKRDGLTRLDIPAGFNTIVYLLDGELEINGENVIGRNLVWFNNDGETIDIKALMTTRFIMLAGEPLNEPVQSYGPFVMNDQTQIMEAIRDAQVGKMGVLIEEF